MSQMYFFVLKIWWFVFHFLFFHYFNYMDMFYQRFLGINIIIYKKFE